ncbi:MAG: TatD family hydrolase [Candidatus Colwellbacteria bacterium]|nr:TatD family hydrolase [Candidatus Colwellbacteria bacterium]
MRLRFFQAGKETKDKQEKAFIAQIELAHELKKPLMIHCRDAYADLIDVLVSSLWSPVSPAGIVHFFSGTKEDAKKLLDLGFYFSFGGVITFVRDYDAVIKLIGLERIVLETDAPYVTPIPHRGKRNEPAYVSYVAEKLAEILGRDLEEVAEQTTKNARKVLRI